VKRAFFALTLVELVGLAGLYVWNDGKLDHNWLRGSNAEPWVRLQRTRLDGERGVVYLERGWEKRAENRIKFRLKFVYDDVQTDVETTLRYKEFQVAMEVNCGTGNVRHLLTTLYGPQGGVLSQVNGSLLEEETNGLLGRSVCAYAA
jgi:hypothetical protein